MNFRWNATTMEVQVDNMNSYTTDFPAREKLLSLHPWFSEMFKTAFKYVKFLQTQIGVLKHMALLPVMYNKKRLDRISQMSKIMDLHAPRGSPVASLIV